MRHEVALAARANETTSFTRVLNTVTDKNTLWLEWACKFPERTYVVTETGSMQLKTEIQYLRTLGLIAS